MCVSEPINECWPCSWYAKKTLVHGHCTLQLTDNHVTHYAVSFYFATAISVSWKVEKNHRITEWLGLEGTSNILQFQLPCCRQSCWLLDQVLDQALKSLLKVFRRIIRMIYVDSDFWRLPGQTQVQSRAISVVRSVCSGTWSVECWVPPRVEIPQAPLPLIAHSLCDNYFPYHNFSCGLLYSLSLFIPLTTTSESCWLIICFLTI